MPETDVSSDRDEHKPWVWFSVLWIALAAILLGLSYSKTRELTDSRETEAVELPIGISGFDLPATQIAAIQFESHRDGSQWRVSLPDSQGRLNKDAIVILPGSLNCTTDLLMTVPTAHATLAGKAATVIKTDFDTESATPGGQIVQHALSKLPDLKAWSFTCKTTETVTHETSFADREFSVKFLPYTSLGEAGKPGFARSLQRQADVTSLRFTALIDNAKDMQVFGGDNQSVSSTILQPEQAATVKFEDERRGNERDTGFVWVGALIALGAAMAIEALRPIVEKIAALLHGLFSRSA